VYVAADKYLEPELQKTAFSGVRFHAESTKSVDVIFDMLVTLSTEMAHAEACSALGSKLFEKHLKALLKHDPYRRHVEQDTKAMWEIIDRLDKLDTTEKPGTTDKPNTTNTLNNMNMFGTPPQSHALLQQLARQQPARHPWQ
jgi:hypothetical protein